LNGNRFTENAEARLYRTANPDEQEYVILETRRFNRQEIAAMITPLDEQFLGSSREGFIRVANFDDNGMARVSEPKRIVFGDEPVGVVRANRFSHRYAYDEMNTQTLPGNPPRILQEANNRPFRPFEWNEGTFEQLNVDLFHLPALGGATTTATLPPVGFASLPRIEHTRGKWELRFLDASGQQIGSGRTVPAGASALASDSWVVEGASQHRNNINDPQGAHEYRAVRLSQGAPETQNLVTTMASVEYPQGYYPSCADLIEVTAQMTTTTATIPALEPNDPYNPVNMCGPFTVRWYLDPKPQVEVTNFPKPIQAADLTWTATIDVRLNTSPMIGSLVGSTYTWQIQIITNGAGEKSQSELRHRQGNEAVVIRLKSIPQGADIERRHGIC
jgi:hypothetical protein